MGLIQVLEMLRTDLQMSEEQAAVTTVVMTASLPSSVLLTTMSCWVALEPSQES